MIGVRKMFAAAAARVRGWLWSGGEQLAWSDGDGIDF